LKANIARGAGHLTRRSQFWMPRLIHLCILNGCIFWRRN
jgi:hypothetical protein